MTDASRDFLSLLGYVFLEHGQGEKAVTVFEALLALDPKDVATSRRLALAYLTSDRHADCLRHCDGHMDRFPVDPEIDFTAMYAGFSGLVMGRKSYEISLTPEGSPPLALPTYVYSRTLPEGERNGATFVRD